MISTARLAIAAVSISLLATLSAHAAGKFPIHNDTEYSAYVYYRLEGQAKLSSRQSIYVRPGKIANLSYEDGTWYWLLAVDYQQRQAPVGWVNASDEMTKNPNVELLLSHCMQCGDSGDKVQRGLFRRWKKWSQNDQGTRLEATLTERRIEP